MMASVTIMLVSNVDHIILADNFSSVYLQVCGS